MRDPRIDPAVGDIVFKGDIGRMVTIVDGHSITYRDYRGRLRYCQITTWREWCKNAEILTRGKSQG